MKTPAGGLAGGNRAALGALLMLVSAAGFALGPTAAGLTLADGSNTITVVAIRSVIGLALMAFLIRVEGNGLVMPRAALKDCLLAGVASAVVSYGLIGAVALMPVSAAVVIFFIHPLLIALMWHVQGRERLPPLRFLLAAIVLMGVWLSLGASLGGLDAGGVALAALAAASMCGMVHYSARAQQHATTAQVNFCLTAVTVIVFVSAATFLQSWELPMSAIGWLGLWGAGLGLTVGLLCFLAAFRFIGPVRATMLGNVEPLLGILLAVIVLGERLLPLQWFGAGLTVAALVLFDVAARRAEPRAGRELSPPAARPAPD